MKKRILFKAYIWFDDGTTKTLEASIEGDSEEYRHSGEAVRAWLEEKYPNMREFRLAASKIVLEPKGEPAALTDKTEHGDSRARVAVYGTLKRGHANHRFLERAEYLGDVLFTGAIQLVDLGAFPGVVDRRLDKSAPNSSVLCEVFAVSQEELRACDGLEGHPNFYERKKVHTPYGRAWLYMLPEVSRGTRYLDFPAPAGDCCASVWGVSESVAAAAVNSAAPQVLERG